MTTGRQACPAGFSENYEAQLFLQHYSTGEISINIYIQVSGKIIIST